MSDDTRHGVGREALRAAIREQYAAVADDPARGYHFHTGRPLAAILGYRQEWFEGVPEASIESFAGTGCPFRADPPRPGESVVDIGCGAGLDSLIAARMVGPRGRVVGVEMTRPMLEKARRSAREAGLENVEFRFGFGEKLPVEDGWADLVISNGLLNLIPDKEAALSEMRRVLGPGGRLRIADILVTKPVPSVARDRVELWTG